MSLRTRVAIAVGVVVLGALAVVAAVVYPAVGANLRGQSDQSLVQVAKQAPEIATKLKTSRTPFGQLVPFGDSQLQIVPGATPGAANGFVAITSRDAQVARGNARPYFHDEAYRGRTYRIYTAPLPGGTGVLVRAALPVSNAASTQTALGWLLLALIPAAALGAAVTARLAAGRVLRPVGRLTETVEQIRATGDLSAPIEAPGQDEISRLGQAFAAMTAVLNESVGAQRRLVADASHELRTPLTSLITNLELLEDGRGVADPQAPTLVRAARDQATELDDLVTDLLDLARYRESTPHREETRLDLLVLGVIDRTRHRCRVQADLEACVVDVDPAAVERAVANLIDNAVKWSAPDDPVHVTVADGRVSVTDHGPGIAEQDLPHIFERFYRASAARGMPGAGLGLAIVGEVAKAHHGSVTVDTGPQGSSFVLDFARI